MNELETEYKGRMDFVRFDLSTTEGYCEFVKHEFQHIPAMMYLDKTGKTVETTDSVVQKDQLKLKLENLLKI